MTKRVALIAAALFALGACSTYEKGEVVNSSPDEINIRVGYDAAVKEVNTRKQAAEHCAKTGRNAVWYGHDRDGNMHYKCE